MAQLVEHYLREVGAACSNHVTPIVRNRIDMRFFFQPLFEQADSELFDEIKLG